MQPLIFDFFHLSPLAGGHLSFKKVLHKTAQYYWETKYSDLYRWTKACLTCQMRNNPKPYPHSPLYPVTSLAVLSKVGLDLCGPFKATLKGNKYILNIICMFTKYVISVPVPDARSNTIAHALLTNCVLVYGSPLQLVSDNAKTFSSSFFQEFCNLLYVNKRYSTPYHSAGNGAVERTFRTYQNMLAKYLSQQEDNFDEFLPFMSFCYNTSVNEMTGDSPYFLMFGRDPRFAVENIILTNQNLTLAETDVNEYKTNLIKSLRLAWNLAFQHNQRAQQRMKEVYDKRAKSSPIRIGDRVLLRREVVKPGDSKKFVLPWTGIFRVIEIIEPNAIIISCTVPNADPFKVHLNQLKKCFTLDGPANSFPTIPDEINDSLCESGAQQIQGFPGYSSSLEHYQSLKNSTEVNSPITHNYNLRSKK